MTCAFRQEMCPFQPQNKQPHGGQRCKRPRCSPSTGAPGSHLHLPAPASAGMPPALSLHTPTLRQHRPNHCEMPDHPPPPTRGRSCILDSPQAGGCPRQCGCPQQCGCLLVMAEGSRAKRCRHRLLKKHFRRLWCPIFPHVCQCIRHSPHLRFPSVTEWQIAQHPPPPEGCIRKGGRGVWLGPPSSQGPPMVPAEGGRKIFQSSNPLGTEGTEAKFWRSASNIERGGEGGPGGGVNPPPLRCTAVPIHHCPPPPKKI